MSITLVAVDFLYHDLVKHSIEQTLKHVDAQEVVIMSDREILAGARHIICDPVVNEVKYNEIMLRGLAEHINTDHALYVQWDGMAHDRTQWQPEFLDCDYIGAVWPWEPAGRSVGNGGFSLRSQRLLEACQDPELKIEVVDGQVWKNEDAVIGQTHRGYLESQHGIKFADHDLARKFSFELGVYEPSFGFHGIWNVFNFADDAAMDLYAADIDYQGWNIYKWHHTLAAVIRRGRGDLYEHMLGQLIATQPDLVAAVAQWLERDAGLDRAGIVID